MKILTASCLVCASLAASAQTLEPPFTLREGTWVCSTPEAYRDALAAQGQGRRLGELRKDLLERQLCLYLDDEELEDLMAPFVTVLGRDGDMVRVSFVIEYYRRIEYLHRKITRMQYSGWTAAENLRSYYP